MLFFFFFFLLNWPLFDWDARWVHGFCGLVFQSTCILWIPPPFSIHLEAMWNFRNVEILGRNSSHSHIPSPASSCLPLEVRNLPDRCILTGQKLLNDCKFCQKVKGKNEQKWKQWESAAPKYSTFCICFQQVLVLYWHGKV